MCICDVSSPFHIVRPGLIQRNIIHINGRQETSQQAHLSLHHTNLPDTSMYNAEIHAVTGDARQEYLQRQSCIGFSYPLNPCRNATGVQSRGRRSVLIKIYGIIKPRMIITGARNMYSSWHHEFTYIPSKSM